MQRSRFAGDTPSGAAALAADLRLEQHRHAQSRLDHALRRWPAKPALHFNAIDANRNVSPAHPKENPPWAR